MGELFISLKEMYPKGTKIRLISMKDEINMKRGLEGEVDFIDGKGQIHVRWDNGSGLALIPGVDEFEKI